MGGMGLKVVINWVQSTKTLRDISFILTFYMLLHTLTQIMIHTSKTITNIVIKA